MSKPILGCPIDYYEDNLFFNSNNSAFGKSCWAAYKISGFNYDFQNRETKDAILFSLIHLIKNFSHAKIYLIPTAEDVTTHYNRLKKNLRSEDILYDNAVKVADDTCAYLKGKMQSWIDYSTFLIVKLQDQAVDEMELIGKQIREAFKAPAYTIASKMLLAPSDITTVTFQKYRRIEEEVYQVLGSCVDLQPLRQRDMQWLLKRIWYRGLKTPFKLNKTIVSVKDENTGKIRREYSEDYKPYCERGQIAYFKKGRVDYYRPHKPDIMHLFTGQLECNGNKGVRVTHDSGDVSYQSFLTVTNIPESVIFPGREWAYRLQKQRVPVEICMDIKNTHYKKALDDLEKTRTELNSQIQDCLDAKQKPPSKLLEAHQQIENLCRELEDNRLPMSEATVSLCISGSNPEQVERDITEVKQHLDKSEFTVERSGADQMQLFMQHIPGTETYTNAFVKKLSPLPIAGGIFGVNNHAGDNVGAFIGMAAGKPVFFCPTQASRENTSPAGTAYGKLGGGKTYNINVICYHHVLNGGRAVVIDPKGERADGEKHWRNLPIIGRYTNVVELNSNTENKGLLDPFIMFHNNLNHANDRAVTCLMKLLNIKSGAKEATIVKESAKKVMTMPNPCMIKVVERIGWVADNDEDEEYKKLAKAMHRNLRATMDIGLSQLMFGDGSEQAINISGRMNVISFKGLSFAGMSKHEDSYSDSEKVSSILMSLAVDFVRQFMYLYPDDPKFVLIDESWRITPLEIGREMIEDIIRLGRSLYTSVFLNGHSVLDLPESKSGNTKDEENGLRGLITYKFCFHTDDEKEAERMLDYLKLDKTKENIDILIQPVKKGGLNPGECLFSDLYGRVSRLQFDAVFSDLDKIFDSTPGKDAEETAPAQEDIEENKAAEPQAEPAEDTEQVAEAQTETAEVAQAAESQTEPTEDAEQGDTDEYANYIDNFILKYGKKKESA